MSTIYLLLDPRTGEVRYVGQTQQSLRKRLTGHVTGARWQPSCYRDRWIGKLLADGRRPVIVAVEETTDADSRECFWITHYRAAGCRLVNMTPGGPGHSGLKSQQHQQRLNEAASRNKSPFAPRLTPEQVQGVRDEYTNGSATSALAERFNVHQQTIVALLKGKTYQHVPDPNLACNGAYVAAHQFGRGDHHGRQTMPDHTSRGESHYARRTPERLSRGDGHYSRCCPDKLARGADNGNAKLTADQVRQIRALTGRFTLKQISDQFGVHLSQVSNILRRKCWRDI